MLLTKFKKILFFLIHNQTDRQRKIIAITLDSEIYNPNWSDEIIAKPINLEYYSIPINSFLSLYLISTTKRHVPNKVKILYFFFLANQTDWQRRILPITMLSIIRKIRQQRFVHIEHPNIVPIRTQFHRPGINGSLVRYSSEIDFISPTRHVIFHILRTRHRYRLPRPKVVGLNSKSPTRTL